MRKFIAIPALFALILASACGASGSDDESSSTTAAPTTEAETSDTTETTEAEPAGDAMEVDEWAEGFCGSFDVWLTDIQTASEGVASQVTPGDLESAKVAIEGLFGTASDITQELIAALESGGAPDVDEGQGLVDLLIEKFEEFDRAALDAQSDAGSLDTSDPATFQSETEALTTRFQDEVNTVGESFDEIDAQYPDPELQDALTSACDF